MIARLCRGFALLESDNVIQATPAPALTSTKLEDRVR